MSSFSGGGGGGSVFLEGTPVSEFLNSGESFTVPADERWILTMQLHANGNSVAIAVNGNRVGYISSNNTSSPVLRIVVKGGDTVSEDLNAGGAAGFSGVAL